MGARELAADLRAALATELGAQRRKRDIYNEARALRLPLAELKRLSGLTDHRSEARESHTSNPYCAECGADDMCPRHSDAFRGLLAALGKAVQDEVEARLLKRDVYARARDGGVDVAEVRKLAGADRSFSGPSREETEARVALAAATKGRG
jgi:hypothetical protein